MRHLRFIPSAKAVPIALLLLSSCVRESARGDAFEASFALETETVFNGEEFSFSVRINREEIKLVAFDFPLCPDLVEVNRVYRTDDGYWTVRKAVSVPTSQRGRLSLTVEDPKTGLRKEFSAMYTAYASSAVTLYIENKPVSSRHLTEGLPAVVSGDDFVFSLRGRAARMIVKDFSCEFNDGTLCVGKEIVFSDNKARITIPRVEAVDGFTPRVLSLTLLNPDTGRDTTLTASYVSAARFTPSVSLQPSPLIEGETASVRLTANRPLFQLREYTAPAWFVLDGFSTNSPEVSLNIDGYALLQTKVLTVDEDGSGVINFELYDSEYTLRSVIVSVPYTATTMAAPEDISLSATDLKLCTGETAVVSVSTSTSHTTNLFTARILSGDGSAVGLYAPPEGERAGADEIAGSAFSGECTISSGKLYLRGMEGKWGPVTIRASSMGNDKVYRDIKVYLRRDVALRLKGAFYDYVCWWPDSIDDMFSDLGSGSECIGWWGLPSSIEAELVTWENRSTKSLTSLKKDEVSTWVKCFSLNDSDYSRLSVSFVVTVGNRVTSRFFFGSYSSFRDPRSRLLDGTDIDRTVSETRPSSINTNISENAAYGHKVSCSRLNQLLRGLDCHADYQHGYGLFVMMRETRHSEDHLGFGSFDISLSSLSYDHDKYKVRWVMSMFECPGEWGEAAPWWSEVGGERPWIISYDD